MFLEDPGETAVPALFAGYVPACFVDFADTLRVVADCILIVALTCR